MVPVGVTTKLKIVKVGMVVPDGNPTIVLVKMVKVQDPKVAVPVAVVFPLVNVNGAVVDDVGAPNTNVSGVFGRPGKKTDPSGMVNCCPTTA